MATRLKRLLRRVRSAPLVVVAGLVGALGIFLATVNPLSAFLAAIAPVGETVAATPVVLEETGAGATCSSDAHDVRAASSTCATINTYGGATALVPSDAGGTTGTSVTTVTFRNTGAAAATSFTVAFDACTQGTGGAPSGGATDYCGKLHVEVRSGPTVVVADTAAATLAGARFSVPVPAPGGASTVPVTVTTYLDSSADNTHQGLSASQPVTWTLSA